MDVQQMVPQGQKPKRTRSLWIRLVIGCIALLCLTAGNLVWVLNTGRVISGDWSTILPIVFVFLAVAFALFTWLFPFSPVDTKESVEIPISIPNTPAPQPPSTVPTSQNQQAVQLQPAWNVPYLATLTLPVARASLLCFTTNCSRAGQQPLYKHKPLVVWEASGRHRQQWSTPIATVKTIALCCGSGPIPTKHSSRVI